MGRGLTAQAGGSKFNSCNLCKSRRRELTQHISPWTSACALCHGCGFTHSAGARDDEIDKGGRIEGREERLEQSKGGQWRFKPSRASTQHGAVCLQTWKLPLSWHSGDLGLDGLASGVWGRGVMNMGYSRRTDIGSLETWRLKIKDDWVTVSRVRTPALDSCWVGEHPAYCGEHWMQKTTGCRRRPLAVASPRGGL